MLRRTILAVAVWLTLVAAASASPAPEPSEKCDDMQTRCLHGDNGLCSTWHDECLVHKAVTGHGQKHSKKSLVGHKRRF